MTADYEKNYYHFVNEIAPYLEILQGCLFGFDFEESKMIIHCKNEKHKSAVNLDIEMYLLFVPGDILSIGGHELGFYNYPLKEVIAYYNGYLMRHPEETRKYLHFKV